MPYMAALNMDRMYIQPSAYTSPSNVALFWSGCLSKRVHSVGLGWKCDVKRGDSLPGVASLPPHHPGIPNFHWSSYPAHCSRVSWLG